MPGEMIQFPANGGTANGYVVKPPSGGGPGVVLVQEWWGLDDHIKSLADRLAGEGYVVVAPDLYHGSMSHEPGEAQKLMMQLNIEQAAKDLKGAAEALQHHGATGSKIGATGFCMGGLLALYLATLDEDVGAVVDFYGVGRVSPDYSRLQGPVLLIGGDRDGGASPQALNSQAQAIRNAGQSADVVIYPGADHAFVNDTRPDVFNEAAARDAWGKMLAHFRANLT